VGGFALYEAESGSASMVARAEGWGWSSAVAHCGTAVAESWLGMEMWRGRWSAASSNEYLGAGESEATVAAIRYNTHTGRPLGSADFTRAIGKQRKRRLALQKRRLALQKRGLALQKRGPVGNVEPGEGQGKLSFGV